MKKLTIVVVLTAIVGMMLPFAVASAQSATVTITEAQMNATYRATNPRRVSVSNVVVDIQEEQLSISSTLTYRGRAPIQVVAIFVPSVSNGRVTWTLNSATANGSAASQDVINTLNSAYAASLRAWWRTQLSNKSVSQVSALTLSNDVMTITYSR